MQESVLKTSVLAEWKKRIVLRPQIMMNDTDTLLILCMRKIIKPICNPKLLINILEINSEINLNLFYQVP